VTPPSGPGADSEGRRATDSKPGRTQVFVMVVSSVVVLALLGYVGWQLATQRGTLAPTADVTGVEPLDDGAVAVEVTLYNHGPVGLERATVSVDCTDPPTEVDFDYVPGEASRVGTVRCPTAENASVTVDSWVRT